MAATAMPLSVALPSLGPTMGAAYVGAMIAAVYVSFKFSQYTFFAKRSSFDRLYGVTNIQTYLYLKNYPQDWLFQKYAVSGAYFSWTCAYRVSRSLYFGMFPSRVLGSRKVLNATSPLGIIGRSSKSYGAFFPSNLLSLKPTLSRIQVNQSGLSLKFDAIHLLILTVPSVSRYKPPSTYVHTTCSYLDAACETACLGHHHSVCTKARPSSSAASG